MHSVVQFGGPNVEQGVAVIADSYWHAKSALDALPVEWDGGKHANDSSNAFFEMARKALEYVGNNASL